MVDMIGGGLRVGLLHRVTVFALRLLPMPMCEFGLFDERPSSNKPHRGEPDEAARGAAPPHDGFSFFWLQPLKIVGCH